MKKIDKRGLSPLKILETYRNLVWPEVEKYLSEPTFPKAFAVPEKYQQISKAHWQMVSDYPLRKGKYLRPTLLLLTAEAMGVPTLKAIKTAAAMQLSEEWLLVHDDFQDKSSLRRGTPTLNVKYGDELAVNAGDALHVIMWKVVFDNERVLGHKKTQLILNEFYQALARTALGQSTEVSWAKDKNLNLNDKDWFFIADGKTSYYTVACPMRLAAIIAGAGKQKLDKLAEFGIYLGRSFQLIDDILDVTSDFAGLKKQIGNDIYEGKRTLLLGHLTRTVKPSDYKKLVSIYKKGRQQKTEEEVAWVIQKMHDYKSLEYAKAIAEKYNRKALEIFEKELKFLSRQPARDNLRTLFRFIIERDR